MSHFVEPLNNATITDLMVTANNYSEGWFGIGTLISIFVISFFALKVFATDKAFSAAAFLTAISAIFFRIMGLVDGLTMCIFILFAGAGFIYLYTAEKTLG